VFTVRQEFKFYSVYSNLRFHCAQFQASHCGGQTGIGAGFLPSTSVFSSQYLSTSALRQFSSTCCSYQKDEEKKTLNLKR
jgi:hypothetical protein